MNQRVLENLTTTERLTLLEQIYAPRAGVRLEHASCRLNDMEWMFDFDVMNLVENRYTYETVKNLFDDLRNLLMPIAGVHPNYGLLCFIHVIIPAGHNFNEAFSKDIQRFIDDSRSLDMVYDYFFSTSTAQDDITLRAVFVDNMNLDKMADYATKDCRI